MNMNVLGKPGTNLPAWQAEKQHPDLCNLLRSGLNEILDPELNLSVIQLGLIRDVNIEADQAIIRMILTTPFCPYGPDIMEKVRARAEAVLGLPTSIDFSLDAWDFSMMDEEAASNFGFF
jgi:metal-sulfur cluster biosynthetic enzyme